MSALLVTGTDTGIGKTFVTATVAAALVARGVRVGVAKPAETGCRVGADGALDPEDARTLGAAARSAEPLATICRHRFPDPLAPALAATRAGRAIDLAALVADLRARAAAHDVLLIEGAGGLLVPLAGDATYADLAVALGAPVLLVVGSRLGAINHTLLSLEVLTRRRIAVRGYVLNRLVTGPDLAVETNGSLLRQLTAVPCLGELPWIADAGALLAALRAGGTPADDARARFGALATHLDMARIAALAGAR